MTVILDHQVNDVRLGVLGETEEIFHDLHLVTFLDVLGSVHTVFAHKEGPFQTADDVVKAFETGYLHPFATNEEAIAKAQQEHEQNISQALAGGNVKLAEHLTRQGSPFVKRLEALPPPRPAVTTIETGGGF